MKRIILTGGGTAGHVTPNIALLPELKKQGFDVHYIGSKTGIEKELISEFDIPYYGISSGKLRRYFDVKNFTDPFRVLKGCKEASTIIKRLQPDVIFSKGGFVTVPVVWAGKKHNVPSIIHESDMSPGLANKLCLRYASKVCTNFPETVSMFPEGKAVLTGSPIRKELFSGNRLQGLDFCGFTIAKPVMLIIGGSLGSAVINECVRNILPDLLEHFQIIHLCGKGKIDESLKGTKGYVQFEYVKKELSDLLNAADFVISRAGANAICELLALKKPNILIPLSAAASRGDQILNASSFEHQGFSLVLREEELSGESLLKAVHTIYQKRKDYIATMEKSPLSNPIDKIMEIINETAKYM